MIDSYLNVGLCDNKFCAFVPNLQKPNFIDLRKLKGVRLWTTVSKNNNHIINL